VPKFIEDHLHYIRTVLHWTAQKDGKLAKWLTMCYWCTMTSVSFHSNWWHHWTNSCNN